MSKNNVISFGEFYINEFFDQVRQRSREEYTEENFHMIDELFTNLSSQNEITDAISKLAEERAASELSIFLFDIFDRAQDYPPTELVEALPEIAEDFVNGLTVMLEEDEEILNAIKKVNGHFKGEPTQEEIPEIELTESVEKTAASDLEESDKDLHSFTEYIELNFIRELESSLTVRLSKEDTDSMINFTRLLIDNLGKTLPEDAPNSIKQLVSQLGKILPWRIEEEYKPAQLIGELPDMIDSFISSLIESDASIVENSLKAQKIVLPEKTKKEKFKREEVPEKPTTIDSLLSEYFQAEVNEHVEEMRGIFKKLEKSPDDPESVRELIEQLQSFKEISMIHGYVILEDFCSEMLALLHEAKKEKKVFNSESHDLVKDLLSILKQTDKLKDSKEETPESLNLRKILDYFDSSLFTTSTPEKVEKDKIDQIDETGAETPGISGSDASELIPIYKELLKDLKPTLKAELSSPKTTLDGLLGLFERLTTGSEILGQTGIAQFMQTYSECLAKGRTVPEKRSKAARGELLNIFNEFSRKISVDFEYETIKEKISKFQDTYLAEIKELTVENTHELLQILMENEEKNLNILSEQLIKIFNLKDNKIKDFQIQHFKNLTNNLHLMGIPTLTVFPEFYINLFESHAGSEQDESVLNTIDFTYRSIIKLITEDGADAKIGEKLDLLVEAFSAKEDAIDETKKEKESIDVKPDTEAEPKDKDESKSEKEKIKTTEASEDEELDEIFKQESEKYLTTINGALEDWGNDPEKSQAPEIIEKSLHSLKASARLMGFNDVADLTTPLEAMFEKFVQTGQKLTSDELVIVKDVLTGLDSGIVGESFNTETLIDALKKIKVSEPSERSSSVAGDKGRGHLKEEQLFVGSGEEDEDLLEIFKDESTEYIAIVEKANQALRKDVGDKGALSQLENAMHSLKTAAKMLGFSEIGQLANSVEGSAVAILKGEIASNSEVNEGVSEAIELIKELTNGEKQNIGKMNPIISRLNIEHLAEKGAGQPETTENQKISVVDAELDEQTQLFVKEGWELLEKVNRDLVNLEKNPKDQAIISDLNRTIHTLKGSAQLLNFKKIGSLAHKIEDLFIKFKESKSGLNGQNMDVIFKSVDTIQALLKSIKSGDGEKNEEVDSLLKQIADILEKPSPKNEPAKIPALPEGPKTKPRVVEIDKTPEEQPDREQVIKITTEKLDNLVNMAAELVINKTQLSSYLDKLKKIGDTFEEDKKRLKKSNHTINMFMEKAKDEGNGKSVKSKLDDGMMKDLSSVSDNFNEVINTFDTVSRSFRSITREFEQNIGQISSLSKALHDDILQVRLVPTKMLFNRFPRAVRDMAKDLKKKVNLVVEGEETEMDRALIESLTDPVMHLIRNAIDHGIETPKERKEQGKSEDGIVLLKARRSKNQVLIEVQDDGRGIDPELVKEEIIRRAVADEKDVQNMHATEILDYLFHPGFSTREEASDVSGRGVGLDVVANQLQRLKGDIRINSTPGKGTIFSIRVPLTLAIAQAMLVTVGSEFLAIPLSSVEETVQFKDPELVEQDEKAFITVRDQMIPVAYLSALLDYGQQEITVEDKSHTAIIVQEAGAHYGLIVDSVIGREEIVVKALGEHLTQVPYISGGTIAGDGSVILILDIPSITQKIEWDVYGPDKDFSAIERARKVVKEGSKETPTKRISRKKAPAKPEKVIIKKKKVKGRAPHALIVDDSVSVRKFVSSVLEKNRYSTIMAEDGPEALEELDKENFDIIITDLEMPKMQGFDLIKKIREQKKLKEIPIIILTGRAGKKHKEKGEQLGANAYITKPFKENDLLKTLENFIEIE